ncbi:hypothetical protein TSOC_010813 [Tetrabaena socialis]|uniref:Uncharacterized protein n=1 Tax=Tetrabaena socialis TaxID=47790 RepID=A0A2J7ZSH5_9CHLO|nr:hypothetical protein TSOC_010811 [Tetrabaena socialis]PNH03194.1 hypothetical protein TSOC_010813 [Tetrabaena socialis]|eukprot:PNH03190.1 hypothetical protein TSOC_010811 [Tetrabaena socialis]
MANTVLDALGASGIVRLLGTGARSRGLHNQGNATHVLGCDEEVKCTAFYRFMIRHGMWWYRVAVLMLRWATEASGSILRTVDLLEMIGWEQMHGQASTQVQADWQVLGAPSPSEYLPLHRLLGEDDEDMPLAQLAAGRWTDRQFHAYVAGLFDADGSVALVSMRHDNCIELRANITQTSCPDLLAAIRDRLGYRYLSGGQLWFKGANAVRFWEEAVLP